jgi:nucleoside phosphorylase
MESAALFTLAQCYGVPYSSIKIVSDNLDVTIDVWRERVVELSKRLVAFVEGLKSEANHFEP